MKKLVLSLVILTFFFTKSSAQADDDQKFNFGLKASPSISWVRVEADGVTNQGVRIGFTYGLMTEFNITRNYSFATGLDISYRGGSFRKVETGINGVAILDKKQKFQFVEIPLALKLKTNEIGYIKYYGLFGFAPGFLVKATEDIESDNLLHQVNRSDRSNQSDFIFFNLSLNVGLGIEYNLGGSTSFTTGLHYTNGLLDTWSIDKAQMRSDAITLNIGVLF